MLVLWSSSTMTRSWAFEMLFVHIKMIHSTTLSWDIPSCRNTTWFPQSLNIISAIFAIRIKLYESHRNCSTEWVICDNWWILRFGVPIIISIMSLPIQINLRLILVSGKTKEFLFSPSDSAGDIAQTVFDQWPQGMHFFITELSTNCIQLISFFFPINRLGRGIGVESGNFATNLPGAIPALQCDAGSARFADGQNDRHAFGAARQSARTELTRFARVSKC